LPTGDDGHEHPITHTLRAGYQLSVETSPHLDNPVNVCYYSTI
jgi:hypothetical protein